MKKIIVLLLFCFTGCSTAKKAQFELKKNGLKINETNQILEYTNEWSGIHGNGIKVIWVKVDKEPIGNITSQIDKKSFKKLPLNSIYTSKIPYKMVDSIGNEGFYKAKNIAEGSYEFIIIDETNSQIIYYLEVI